jgi:holo-[acyl-carrier protein] synthase
MMLGLGTDLVAVDRVEAVLARHGERFLARVFTAAERAECLRRARPAVHLAARLAAKEAAMKALGSGWGAGVRWQDIEVCSDGETQPVLRLAGVAKTRADDRGVRRSLVSLSHDGGFALAAVVLTD